MPIASAGVVKYHYQDYDTDIVNEAPPILNTWYEAFDAEDVRLLWCEIYQSNGEAAAKDVEVRWTIDGNVYLLQVALAHGTSRFVYRDHRPSGAGTSGLTSSASDRVAALYTDKRGQAFKVEVRITEALGTNQVLICRPVRETLELT